MRAIFLPVFFFFFLGGLESRAKEEPQFFERCPVDSPELVKTQEAIRAFGVSVYLHVPGSSLEPLRNRFESLLRLPCLRASHETAHGLPGFNSLSQLLHWWGDGGEAWLLHYVAPGQLSERLIVVPPQERPFLGDKLTDSDPRRMLLCAEKEKDCGLETMGWSLRAERSFEDHFRKEHDPARSAKEKSDKRPAAAIEDCEKKALSLPVHHRYLDWYRCVVSLREKHTVLSAGRLRSPTRGWLVLSGRRGHYGFCDELRAYDLASGGALVVKSCSELALGSNGQVDRAATDSARQEKDQTGRVPVENLREAVWMLLQMDLVDADHTLVETFKLPSSLEPRWQESVSYQRTTSADFGSDVISTDQTQLSWAWIDGESVLAKGELVWPYSSNAAEDHAARLIQITEAGLQPGCCPLVLPPYLISDTCLKDERTKTLCNRLQKLAEPKCPS